jgi:superfamily I DNA/RNA helicase
VFEPSEPLSPDDSLRIVEAPSRYQEIEKIGADIADLLVAGENPAEVAVVVRHIETYGEMLEDVFNRYRIPFRFETGVPLLRVPFIKYWLAVLDLVSNDRSRESLARVMSSAYFRPRLSPAVDVDRTLAEFGYIDRRHLRASALAARKNSPFTAEIERFELVLDDLERSSDTVTGFMSRFPQTAPVTARDRQAWRVFSEEMTAAAAMHERGALLAFGQFRKLASEIAALRTVDRLTASDTAPGLPRVHIVHPHSLGSRPYRWIFAPGLCDGEFPARTLTNPLLSDSLVEAINARIHQRRLKSARDRSRREPLYLFMILDSATQRGHAELSGRHAGGRADLSIRLCRRNRETLCRVPRCSVRRGGRRDRTESGNRGSRKNGEEAAWKKIGHEPCSAAISWSAPGASPAALCAPASLAGHCRWMSCGIRAS